MTAHYMQLIGEQESAPRKPEFSESDVTQFMSDLAACEESPARWLKINGCDELPDYVADLLKSMSITCVAGHGLSIPGSDRFYQAMKQLAIQKFDNDQD